MAESRLCSIDGCDKPRGPSGWCRAHHRRWRLYGDPTAGRTSPGDVERYYRETVLTHGDGGQCLLWPFGKTTKGYGKMWIDGRTHTVSRLVCEYINGKAPSPEHEAAHNCGKGHEGCVNPLHMRWATRAENFSDKVIHGTSMRGKLHWKNRMDTPPAE